VLVFLNVKVVHFLSAGGKLLVPHTGTGLNITDNFNSYIAGALDTQGNWLACLNAMAVIDLGGGNKVVGGNTAGNLSCCKRSEAFTANHRAKITLNAINTSNDGLMGVAVRCSGAAGTSNYYFYAAGGNGFGRGIYMIINGLLNFISYRLWSRWCGRKYVRIKSYRNFFKSIFQWKSGHSTWISKWLYG
jgi:hypothetical protein